MPWISDFLIFCVVSAYTPGPNNLLSMSYAARYGIKRSFRFNLGVTAGLSVVITVCTICSAALYQFLPKAQTVMQVLGAAYLVWLAWKIWREPIHMKENNDKGVSFLSGMLLQFVNPKIYIYAITAMSLYVLPVYRAPGILACFVALLCLISFTGTMLWTLGGHMLCGVFARHAKAVNLVMALLLVYCAGSLFF